MTTTFARTGSDDFPLHLKCMISGPPKSGKTSLLGTVPNIIIGDTEPHANNLQSVAHLNVPYKTIRTTTDLRDLHMVLSNESLRKQAAQALGMPDIEAVAIDTLDTLQGLMKKERMKENRTTQFLRDDWGWLKTEMESILQAFLSLPMHVFFVVHTKTKDVGTEKSPRSVILPGLEGSIAESIAGMVGYSLLSFRKGELNPDGTSYTKYWLRSEGDETYEYLGNRAAGRLPDVIEPDFTALLDAAKAGLEAAKAAQAQVSGSMQAEVDLAKASIAESIQVTGTPVQEAAPSQGQPEPVQPVVETQAATAPPTLPADDEPVNSAALQHLSKVYAVLGLEFPEDLFKGSTLGVARDVVRMWKAVQQDHAEGKSTEASPEDEMRKYLASVGLMTGAAPEVEAVVPNIRGTAEEVMAYVGDDLAKVQEAYDLELTRLNAAGELKPRKTVLDKLIAKGAQVQTSVENSASTEPVAEVTQSAPIADVPSTEDEAIGVIEESLGKVEVISTAINANALCEECGNQIDDVDLALLGKNRYGRVLCVADYLAEGKKKSA